MRISGTEPLLVILSKTMTFKKLKSDVPKQAVAKKDGVTMQFRDLCVT